jgi:Tfp pilus assembly protein PilN
MITLNLLPPAEKNELRLNKIARLFVLYGSALVFLSVFFLICLFSIWFFLSTQLAGLEKEIARQKSSASSESLEKLKESIEKENQRIKIIYNIQSQQKKYSASLESIAKLVPVGITLNSFNLDAKTGKAAVSGVAKNGDVFLSFQDALKKNQAFSQVEWPISSLNPSGSEAVNFQITFQINE